MFKKGYKPTARKPRVSGYRVSTIRTKDGGTVEVTLSRSQAIKAMCTECMGWSEGNPKDCTDTLCPLYSFRGKIRLAYQDGTPDEPDTDEPDTDEEDAEDSNEEETKA